MSNKKIKQELEAIHENQEMAYEAQAEMLHHNPLLKLHAMDEPETAPLPLSNGYIKSTEDMVRIARNTTWDTVSDKEKPLDIWQEQTKQVFELQMGLVSTAIESWSNMMQQFLSYALKEPKAQDL